MKIEKLTDINIAPNGGFKGFGKLGLETEPATNSSLIFSEFISTVIGLITLIAIIWFIFTLLTGAISFISSGGDKTAIEGAKKRIFNGLIGLVVTIIGIFIIRLFGYLIGIPEILNFISLFGVLTDSIIK